MSLPAPDPNSFVIVTGASAGIGADLARCLAEQGHDLALVARRLERLEALAKELRDDHHVTVDVFPCDLADDGERARLITDLQASGRFVAGVCNNAGFGSFGRLWQLERDREQEMVRTNVLALHDLTMAFLPPMVDRGEGAVLNVASIAGYQPLPGNATYAATKAFVQSFSEAVHAELAGTGVSVTTLNPGPVATEFSQVANVEEAESRLPGFVAVSSEEVAAAAIGAMIRGRRTVVPGLVTKALGISGRLTPRTVLLPAARLATNNRMLRGSEKNK